MQAETVTHGSSSIPAQSPTIAFYSIRHAQLILVPLVAGKALGCSAYCSLQLPFKDITQRRGGIPSAGSNPFHKHQRESYTTLPLNTSSLTATAELAKQDQPSDGGNCLRGKDYAL